MKGCVVVVNDIRDAFPGQPQLTPVRQPGKHFRFHPNQVELTRPYKTAHAPHVGANNRGPVGRVPRVQIKYVAIVQQSRSLDVNELRFKKGQILVEAHPTASAEPAIAAEKKAIH